ncbi:MAG: hypothetical protein WB789_09280 [Thermoplasmata archaeon]
MTVPRQDARHWQHVAAGAGAFAVGDLIVGFAAFSSITLASLGYFSGGWIQQRAGFVAHGLMFGSVWQLELAWFTVLAALPLIALTVFLAVRAMEMPRRVYYLIRGGVQPLPARVSKPRRSRTVVPQVGVRPDYVASFWNGTL